MRYINELALNYINPSILDPRYNSVNNVEYSYDQEDANGNAIPDYFRIFSKFSFEDPMDIEPENGSETYSDELALQLLLASRGVIPSLTDERNFYSYSSLQNSLSSVVKAMMVALLEDNGKRTTTLANRTLDQQKEIFFNALKNKLFRDNNSLPWSTWRDSHSTLNISSVSRNEDYAYFTTTAPHGLDSTYDDWGAIININDTSFNTSPSKYNGDPIVITSSTQFVVYNEGSNVSEKSVTGTADIRIGWGGSSINFHQYSG